MTFKILSPKQKEIFKWCHKPSTKDLYDAIICDGAIRSGKTTCMITSFVLWAMRYFNGQSFGICGKTVQSAERNIITPLQQSVDIKQYYTVSYTRSNKLLTVKCKNKVNYFYIFGGRDESSYTLIQGITLAGVMLDEVALMPRSFVEQALARCSVDGAKFWFNCNPDNPTHWFYQEWISKADDKKTLYLHFLMSDNPSLSDDILQRYENLYIGVFRDRYILGKWVKAEGLVYSMFDRATNVVKTPPANDGEYFISIDYGTINPTSMGLWRVTDAEAIRAKEYYFDSRKAMYQKTDEEYYTDLVALADGYKISKIIIDPSAASFITLIRRHGKFIVTPANNEVIDGIRYTGMLIKQGKIKVTDACADWLREVMSYAWDEKSNNDAVKKEYDHAMDETRYLCNTVLRHRKGFQFEREVKPKSINQTAQVVRQSDVSGGWG